MWYTVCMNRKKQPQIWQSLRILWVLTSDANSSGNCRVAFTSDCETFCTVWKATLMMRMITTAILLTWNWFTIHINGKALWMLTLTSMKGMWAASHLRIHSGETVPSITIIRQLVWQGSFLYIAAKHRYTELLQTMMTFFDFGRLLLPS